jgi:hypothetical protein
MIDYNKETELFKEQTLTNLSIKILFEYIKHISSKTFFNNCNDDILFDIKNSLSKNDELFKSVLYNNYVFSNLTDEFVNQLNIAAILNNPLLLEHISNPSEALKVIAVSKNGQALQYINRQTECLCIIACKQNGHNLKFVKCQTSKIIETSLKENVHSYRLE